jgi:hypothetical protein
VPAVQTVDFCRLRSVKGAEFKGQPRRKCGSKRVVWYVELPTDRYTLHFSPAAPRLGPAGSDKPKSHHQRGSTRSLPRQVLAMTRITTGARRAAGSESILSPLREHVLAENLARELIKGLISYNLPLPNCAFFLPARNLATVSVLVSSAAGTAAVMKAARGVTPGGFFLDVTVGHSAPARLAWDQQMRPLARQPFKARTT